MQARWQAALLNRRRSSRGSRQPAGRHLPHIWRAAALPAAADEGRQAGSAAAHQVSQANADQSSQGTAAGVHQSDAAEVIAAAQCHLLAGCQNDPLAAKQPVSVHQCCDAAGGSDACIPAAAAGSWAIGRWCSCISMRQSTRWWAWWDLICHQDDWSVFWIRGGPIDHFSLHVSRRRISAKEVLAVRRQLLRLAQGTPPMPMVSACDATAKFAIFLSITS